MHQTTLFFLLLMFLFDEAGAQLQVFTGVSFEHEVTQRWGYDIEIDHRQELGTGRENRVLLLLAANRKLTSALNVTPGVRYTPRYGADRPGELRLFTDFNFQRPFGDSRFALEGRLRLQHERMFADTGTFGVSAARPRVGLSLAANPFLDLVAEYEARFRSDLPRPFSRNRYTLALEQQLTPGLSVDLFYRIERRVQANPVDNEPTLGFYLVYRLPDKRDRKWDYRRPFGRLLNW